jgi:hypothetical protein
MAASGTLEVTAPKNNGSARIFVTDLTGGTITDVNIAGNWTATQKRDAIFNAIQAQAAANGWAIAKKGAAGITITNGPNDPLVINFNPRGTGEVRDVITGARGVAFPGGHARWTHTRPPVECRFSKQTAHQQGLPPESSSTAPNMSAPCSATAH